MKNLIKQILREEVSKKEYDAGVILMDMLTKNAEYKQIKDSLFVFTKNKKTPLFYLTPETMYGRTLKYDPVLFADFGSYLSMGYHDFIQFMIEWSKTVLKERVNYVVEIDPIMIQSINKVLDDRQEG